MDSQPPRESPRPRNRLEDEVLEILHKSDRPPSNVVRFQSRFRRSRVSTIQRIRRRARGIQISSLALLLAMLALAIAAAIVEERSQLGGRVLALLSVACLIALFVRRWVRPEQPQAKMWRGRTIDFVPPPQRPHWLDRLLGGPRRPRR